MQLPSFETELNMSLFPTSFTQFVNQAKDQPCLNSRLKKCSILNDCFRKFLMIVFNWLRIIKFLKENELSSKYYFFIRIKFHYIQEFSYSPLEFRKFQFENTYILNWKLRELSKISYIHIFSAQYDFSWNIYIYIYH